MESKLYAKNFHRVIGIDPDLRKSGYAFIEGETKAVTTLTFWQLYDMLREYKKSQIVYLEAGWLNKGLWQDKPSDSLAVKKRKAKNVGENHAIGKAIEEMLIYLKIPYRLIIPKNSKVKDIKYFEKLSGIRTLTSHQEQRDAFMLILGLRTKK